MLYVVEKDFSRRIDLTAFLAPAYGHDFVAWMYPESKRSHIFGSPVSRCFADTLEPVTVYEDGTKAPRTDLIRWSPSVRRLIESSEDEINESVDSICFYQKRETQWCFCAIGHEGMILVRDTDLLDVLRDAGFNASKTPPDWW